MLSTFARRDLARAACAVVPDVARYPTLVVIVGAVVGCTCSTSVAWLLSFVVGADCKARPGSRLRSG